MDRRGFLKMTAAAVPLARVADSFALVPDGSSASQSSAVLPDLAADIPWQQKLRRIGQTNFTEHDPAVLNVEEWVDYWASAKVGAVFISITGIVAFYPSKVPFFRHAKYLNGRDFAGELHDAARKRGLHCIARYSPDLNWGDALAAHPDWLMRDEHGQPMPYAEAPELFQTCMFSEYMTDYFPAVMREVNSRYDMDAHYTNGWPSFSLPVCYCNICRQLPPPKTPAYWDKFNDRVMSLCNLYDSIAKEKKPTSFYMNNMGGGVHATPNLARLGEFCRWFQADNQGRGGE